MGREGWEVVGAAGAWQQSLPWSVPPGPVGGPAAGSW